MTLLKFVEGKEVGKNLDFSHWPIIEPDILGNREFIDNDTYSSDIVSGLDRLDVTATQGLLFNTVSAQLGHGGTFAGWQYATGVQFNTLIANVTESAPSSFTTAITIPAIGVEHLLSLLGKTVTVVPETRMTGIIADVDVSGGQQRSSIRYRFAKDGITREGVLPDRAISQIYDPSLSYAQYLSSLMVKSSVVPSAVPITAEAFMFAPALLGLLGLRRKNKISVA